jgi:lysozyme family protein
MSTGNFAACLNFTLREEGGFVHNPKDPGGATNFGITLATLRHYTGQPSLTEEDLKGLSASLRAEIYRESYWKPVRGDDLPTGLDLLVFDFGVNVGPATSIKHLQRVLHVEADGRIGPQTLSTISRFLEVDLPFHPSMPVPAVWPAPSKVLQLYHLVQLHQQDFYQHLDSFHTFGNGWMKRTNRRYVSALMMSGVSI